MLRPILIMLSIFLLLPISLMKQAHAQAQRSAAKPVSRHTVRLADLELMGDPQRVTRLSQLSLAGHHMSVMCWQVDVDIDAVMQHLTLTLPLDTVAWEEAGHLRLHWQSASHTHILRLTILSEKKVELVATSMTLSDHRPKRLPFQTLNMHPDSYAEIKKAMGEHAFKAQVLLDVKDDSSDAQSFTLLYSTTTPVTALENALRLRLVRDGWQVALEAKQKKHPTPPRTLYAFRYQQVLHVDILETFGKSFLYIHQSRSLEP
jgi:hypothetical protein